MTEELKEFLVEKLDNLINRIDDTYLNELCNRLVGKEGRYRQEFLIAPAAKGMHHAYPGGLLEHSLEVADFCISDYETLRNHHKYDNLNLNVMLAASLLHDLAKIQEYMVVDMYDGNTLYSITETGKMIGHLCLSAMWVYSEIDNINNFPQDLKEHLIHILLSHHGRTDWGAAVLPKTIEAEFFHTADHRSAIIANSRYN